MPAAVPYVLPGKWIAYDWEKVFPHLAQAKADLQTLRMMPLQREWVEQLQTMELKREVAGTSRIEGAEFLGNELEEALTNDPKNLRTRSQRQAHAAVETYRWIATLPDDRPVDEDLLLEIHRRIVRNADDDHCPPGRLRGAESNVTFGRPPHRGASGGQECKLAFSRFLRAMQEEFRGHDPILQAMAAHYHLAAIHPFLDGNGRTARALEALLLQRAGLRDSCFIAMSNYYYDEKDTYLQTLAETRAHLPDLSPFFCFALKGLHIQASRVIREARVHVQKALYRQLAYDLFNRLMSTRRRVLKERQLALLNQLLAEKELSLSELRQRLETRYVAMKEPYNALVRDINGLLKLGAIRFEKRSEDYFFAVRLEWPSEITESSFMRWVKELPKARTYGFLDHT